MIPAISSSALSFCQTSVYALSDLSQRVHYFSRITIALIQEIFAEIENTPSSEIHRPSLNPYTGPSYFESRFYPHGLKN